MEQHLSQDRHDQRVNDAEQNRGGNGHENGDDEILFHLTFLR
jgi:hypothetical protein